MASRNRGKKKPKLSDLSRISPTREETRELLDEFARPRHPLVTAILGQALVETELDQLLRSHFARRDDETWAKLTDTNGPLATFYSKITAAYAFGICDEVIRDGLNTIRNVRNNFAHSKRRLNFSHELIVKELAAISLPSKAQGQVYKLLKEAKDFATNKPVDPQRSYSYLCSNIVVLLLRRQNQRLKARTRRLKRKYQKGLAKSLGAALQE